VPVDAAVFDDPTQAEVAALAAYNAWARQLPKGPKHAADTVRALNLRTRMVGRLVSDCVGRRVVWRSEPAPAGKRVGTTPIAPESVDPWTADAARLRADSRHIARCGECKGAGKLSCADCQSNGRLACSDCDGAGKVEGQTSAGQPRLLNCKACRGRGTVTCPACVRGRVVCPACAGQKKVDRWLHVEESVRADIQVEPDGDVTRAFVWGKDGVDARDEKVAADAKIVDAIAVSGMMSPAALRGRVPSDWLDQHWAAIQPRLRPGERVRSQRLCLLWVPSIEVTYSLDNRIAQTVDFEGLRLLAPPAAVDQLFHDRARKLQFMSAALVLIPLVLAVVYLTRGAYFVSSAVGGLLVCCALASAAIYKVLSAVTLGRPRARAWLPAALAPLLGAGVLAFAAEPEIATARTYVSSGDYDAAARELAALGGRDEAALAPVYADLFLQQVQAAPSWRSAKRVASVMAPGTAQHQQAMAHIDRMVAYEIQIELQGGNFQRAEQLLAETSAAYAGGPEGATVRQAAALGVAQSCLRAERWECVFAQSDRVRALGAPDQGQALRANAIAQLEATARQTTNSAQAERDRTQRIELASRALALWSLWSRQTTSELPRPAADLRRRLDGDLADDKRIEARRQAEAERKRNREQARAQREQRQLEQAERRRERASAPLLCCDGTTSPSCTCGGSHRGCCSHHHGVCGCAE
jgi:hypothetical protein